MKQISDVLGAGVPDDQIMEIDFTEPPISLETAVFLVGQHSFDHFLMRDPESQEEYEALIRDTLEWWASGNGVASTERTLREPSGESRNLGPTEEAKG